MDVCASSLYTLTRSSKIFLKLAQFGQISVDVIFPSVGNPVIFHGASVLVKKVLWKIPQRLPQTNISVCREMKIM